MTVPHARQCQAEPIDVCRMGRPSKRSGVTSGCRERLASVWTTPGVSWISRKSPPMTYLTFRGCGLTVLSTKIADLRDLVTLQQQSPTGSPRQLRSLPYASASSSPLSPVVHRLRERPFARTQSAPAAANLFAGQGRRSLLQARGLLPPPVLEERGAVSDRIISGSRTFTRSRTGAVTLGEKVEGSRPNLAVYLARNMLTR